MFSPRSTNISCFQANPAAWRNGERPALVHLAGHMEQAGAPHQGVVDVEERGFAVLRCCSRLCGHGDVLLFGHATSLVNAGAGSVPAARRGSRMAPRPRRRRTGRRATVEPCQAPTSSSSPKLTATCARRRAPPSTASQRAWESDGANSSVDDDAELRERFAEEIPVVLVDGVQRDFWKIDEVRLDRTLRRALGQQP